MGNVFQIHPKHPRNDVVAHYKKQLARAKSGEIQGGMEVLSLEGRACESSIFGEFASDTDYAVHSARAGFERLLGHAQFANPYPLPMRLRKDYKDETSKPLVLRVRS